MSHFENMSDDQLYEYVNKLETKIGIARRLPNGSQAIEQLSMLRDQARQHLTERMLASSFKQMMAQRPAEINTDPDMANTAGSTEKASPKAKQPINRVQVRRSDKPINAIDLSPSPPKDDSK
jgi:hypothetical protein